MHSSLEVRSRVLDAIGTAMKTTLARYGLELVELTSFQFLCPEHDAILRKVAAVLPEPQRAA